MHKPVSRLIFETGDGHYRLAIAPHMVSAHIVKPYTRWEEFRPRIENALNTIPQVVTTPEIERIGVRYINHIDLPDAEEIELDDYFNVGPRGPVDEPMTAFVHRTEYTSRDGKYRTITMFASAPRQVGQKELRFLLDVDAMSSGDAPIAFGDAMATVDILHQREHDVFEKSITDKSRELFS